MRIAPALTALLMLASASVAGTTPAPAPSPVPKKLAFRAVVYFAGNKSDSTGPYSEVILRPRSSAAAPVRLRGAAALEKKLEKAFLEIEFETAADCSLGCDAVLRKFVDVVNPVDVRDHPLRGSPKRLSP